MIITAHQPAYMPWLGYFHKLSLSDLYVILDDVQLERNSFTRRNNIIFSQGTLMLTVPVFMKGHREKKIRDIQIDNSENWKRKHLNSLRMSYSKHPFFECYFPWLVNFFDKDWKYLTDITIEMLHFFLKELVIDVQILKQSDLNVSSYKQDLILELCKVCNADTYISGIMGKDYLDDFLFKTNNINVYYQDYKHPEYRQLNNYPFISHLGIIDLLMNVGGVDAKQIILSGNIDKSYFNEL